MYYFIFKANCRRSSTSREPKSADDSNSIFLSLFLGEKALYLQPAPLLPNAVGGVVLLAFRGAEILSSKNYWLQRAEYK